MIRILLLLFFTIFSANSLVAKEVTNQNYIYNPGVLKPIDSSLKVKVGDKAPDFTLNAISGKEIQLSTYKSKNGVVLSFIPAAWTPVCSDQWPGYNISKSLFQKHDATLLGIAVDNIPTLHAWIQKIGPLWFEVLSDFWPHGGVADIYGVLRSDGTADRALIFIDKEGIIRDIIVSDINQRPPLEDIVDSLKKLK